MAKIYYFAYGHHLARREMEQQAPSHRVYGLAYLTNQQLTFTASHPTEKVPATASFQSTPGQKLYGLLYELQARDLEQLDETETSSTKGEVPKPPYQRELTQVYVPGIQRTCQAWVYVASYQANHLLPTPAYVYKVFSAARIIPGYQPKELARLEALLIELRPSTIS